MGKLTLNKHGSRDAADWTMDGQHGVQHVRVAYHTHVREGLARLNAGAFTSEAAVDAEWEAETWITRGESGRAADWGGRYEGD